MRLLGKIAVYIAAIVAMYLTALWGWGIWFYALALPVGLLVLLLSLLLRGEIFSARETYPNIRAPRNQMEAALLLQKILNTAEDPSCTEWRHFEPYNLAWAQFIFDQGADGIDRRLKVLAREVLDLEERHTSPNDDYDYESGPVYTREDVRNDFYGLVSEWFDRAEAAGEKFKSSRDYLNPSVALIPSPAKRVLSWFLGRG